MTDQTIDLDSRRTAVSLAQIAKRRHLSQHLQQSTAPGASRPQNPSPGPEPVQDHRPSRDAEWSDICAQAETLLARFSRIAGKEDLLSQALIQRFLRNMNEKLDQDRNGH